MIQKMNFYESWFAMTKRVAFYWLLLAGAVILSVAYVISR